MSVPYTFANLPNGTAIPLSYLDDDFAYLTNALNNPAIVMQSLTITTINTIPALSQSYVNGVFLLILNGVVFCPVGSPAPFSVSGTTVTWTSTSYTIYPGDNVVAVYSCSR